MIKKIAKDVSFFITLSLLTVALYMVLRSKTDLVNKEYVALLFLLLGILLFLFKAYSINIGTILYSIVTFLVLLTLIDVYPAMEYFVQYSIVALLSFLFHRFRNKTERNPQ